MATPLKEITGNKYGKLLVLGRVGSNSSQLMDCLCDCGTRKHIDRKNLTKKKCGVISCGCEKRRVALEGRTHGACRGGKLKRLYSIWSNMRQRATDVNHPSAKYYILRGIGICDEWLKYAAFEKWAMSNGYSDTLTIDRTDNNKGYSPENCRWVTQKTQNSNRRDNVYFTYKGDRYSRKGLADIAGITEKCLWHRIETLGWPVEKAVETPLRKIKKLQERTK